MDDVYELREHPQLLTKLSREHRSIFRLARHMKMEGFTRPSTHFAAEEGFVTPFHRSKFRSIHRLVTVNGINRDKPPVIKGDKVRDGLHRIAYFIAMDLPCLVRIN